MEDSLEDNSSTVHRKHHGTERPPASLKQHSAKRQWNSAFENLEKTEDFSV